MNFNVLKGNIAYATTDAVVLPANSKLKEGKGASEAIFKAAGRKKLAEACKKIGYCEVGTAVPTLAYDMQAKYIIHAVVPKWKDGNSCEYNLLCSAYISVLKIADMLKCENITIPLLASGNNGFDLNLAFEIAIETIKEYDAENLKEINLILFTNESVEFVKSKGYKVDMQLVDYSIELEKAKVDDENKKKINEAREQQQKKIKDGVKECKNITENYIIENVVEYMTKKENLEKIGKFAIKIVKHVIG